MVDVCEEDSFQGKNVQCQTISDFAFSTFEKFDINYEELQQKQSYITTETLQDYNIDFDTWKETALKQLKLRDNLIKSLRNNQIILVNQGITVESDLKCLQFKIGELNEKIEHLTKLASKSDASKTEERYFDNDVHSPCVTLNEVAVPVERSITSSDELNLKPDNKTVDKIKDESSVVLPVVDNDDNNIRWSSNIAEEVQSIAEEIVENSGYVFVEEYAMYYDSSSGYYYDPNTSLYYDGKTGTYFYYDHESQNYKFHSQVYEEPVNGAVEKGKENNHSKQEYELEEGECSNSSSDIQDNIEDCISPSVPNEDLFNPVNDIAPSLRLMVTNGEWKGQLHVVTLDGGTIGREETSIVYLQDLSVSKMHAFISYKSDGFDDHHYYIKDIGSNNGTYVKGQRLSESKKESHLVELGHGWDIQCGEVCLTCHIHPGNLTCNSCEPGLIMDLTKLKKVKTTTQLDSVSKERERRRQNKCLRKKFALEWHNDKEASQAIPLHQDRAAVRRKTVGSENPYQKTEVASIDTNISKDNKGFQLLSKMGWSEGQGLGLKEDGITQPVVPVVPFNRTGLGGCPSVYYIDNTTSISKPISLSSKMPPGSNIENISTISFIPSLKDET